MKIHNAKLKFLEIDLKGCVYLNHLSHSNRIAAFFKIISRLGDGVFWYVMCFAAWGLRGLEYGLQILYIILGGTFGTLIYKILKTNHIENAFGV